MYTPYWGAWEAVRGAGGVVNEQILTGSSVDREKSCQINRMVQVWTVSPSRFSTTSMSHTPRARRTPVPQPGPQEYAAVPQSPGSGMIHSSGSQYQTRPLTRTPSVSSNYHQNTQSGRGAIAAGVASVTIGAGYGPYSVCYFPTFAIPDLLNVRSIIQTTQETLVFTILHDLVLLLPQSNRW